MNGPVVDLSFKNLEHISAAAHEEPHSGLRPLKTNSERKYLSRSLRFSYNKIRDLSDLTWTVNYLMSEPLKLGWLDLSYNQITKIEPVFGDLPDLRVLHLHCNNIATLQDVNLLGKLEFLHTITLHGNPVEKIQGYRRYVISVLPRLKKMDFSAVTREERVLAHAWHPCKNRGKTTTGSSQ